MSLHHQRVLLLRSSIGVFGAERVVLELAAGLMKSRFKPVIGVIGNRHPLSSQLSEKAGHLGLPSVFFASKYPFHPKTVIEISKYVRQNKISLLHSHGYKANFYAVIVARLTHAASIATCHPWTETKYSYKSQFYTFLDKIWLRGMDSLIAVSAEVSHQLRGGSGNKKCTIISNSISGKRFAAVNKNMDLLSALGISDGNLLIGTVGRLVAEKGYQYLFSCAKILSAEKTNIKFLLIGDGPLRPELEKTAREMNLDHHIVFLGNRDDIPELLACCDVFMLSSVSEGLPMALLEAMAMGKPIVATEVGDVPRVIRSGYSGILVPPKDGKALATSLKVLLDNPQRAKSMAIKAKAEVARRFSADKMVKRYIAQYEKLLTFRPAR